MKKILVTCAVLLCGMQMQAGYNDLSVRQALTRFIMIISIEQKEPFMVNALFDLERVLDKRIDEARVLLREKNQCDTPGFKTSLDQLAKFRKQIDKKLDQSFAMNKICIAKIKRDDILLQAEFVDRCIRYHKKACAQ